MSEEARRVAGRVERVLVVLATVAVVAINALAGAGLLNDVSTGEVARRFDLPYTPAGYAFAIWSLIYLGLTAFTVAQAVPSRWPSSRLDAIRPAYVFSSVANGAWLWFWHHEALLGSLAVMALLLGSLTYIYRTLAATPPATAAEAWWLDRPLRLYCAWITVATLVNLAVVLAAGGMPDFDPVLLSQLMIAATFAVGVFVYRRLRDPLFLCVIGWAAAAIALKAGQPLAVSAPAMLVCGLLGLGAIGLLVEGDGGLQSTTG
jgi:tryptophan-rich sensory protein